MENIEKNPELDNMDEATLCQIMRTILEKGIEITQKENCGTMARNRISMVFAIGNFKSLFFQHKRDVCFA